VTSFRWRFVFALVAATACAPVSRRAPTPGPQWVGTWMASPQLVEPRNLPPAPGLAGSTLRQVVHVSVGGPRVRVRFSNTFGGSPLAVATAHIARSLGGGAIDSASDRALTFGGLPSIVIMAGAMATSDPIDDAIPPFGDLAVSIQVAAAPTEVTGHPGSRTTSYLQSGNWVTAGALPDAVRTEHWYILCGIDVTSVGPATAIVTLGNSITDGRGSGTDRNNRWPDNLAQRLQGDPRTRQVAVLNAGIGGNMVLEGGLGPPALTRLDRDVFERDGVRWLIVLEGVNDIGAARTPGAAATVASSLIQGYQQIIARARAHGLRVYGATILPFGGSFYDDAEREAARQAVNQWIRTGGAWDAVIDFDAAMRDPANVHRLLPEADSGDHLHPGEAGYRIMAAMIDLELFTR
jgi:lysophospholipase L1-like esterase